MSLQYIVDLVHASELQSPGQVTLGIIGVYLPHPPTKSVSPVNTSWSWDPCSSQKKHIWPCVWLQACKRGESRSSNHVDQVLQLSWD